MKEHKQNIVYIGRYASEAENDDFLTGAIVNHGQSINQIFSYSCDVIDNNDPDWSTVDHLTYIRNKMSFFLESQPDTKFVIYCPNYLGSVLKDIQHENIICRNSPDIYSMLDSKIFTRYWLMHYCETLPYMTLPVDDAIGGWRPCWRGILFSPRRGPVRHP